MVVVLSRELWAPAATGLAAALWSGAVRGRLLRLRAGPRAGPRPGGQGHRGADDRDPAVRVRRGGPDRRGAGRRRRRGPGRDGRAAGLGDPGRPARPGQPAARRARRATCWPGCSWATWSWPASTCCPGSRWTAGGWPGRWSGGLTGRRLLATRVTAAVGRALAAVLVLGGAGAAIWQQTPRWLPQVVLGLFLWRAAADGERSAARLGAARRAGRARVASCPWSSPPACAHPTVSSRWPTSAASPTCWPAWRSSPGRSS